MLLVLIFPESTLKSFLNQSCIYSLLACALYSSEEQGFTLLYGILNSTSLSGMCIFRLRLSPLIGWCSGKSLSCCCFPGSKWWSDKLEAGVKKSETTQTESTSLIQSIISEGHWRVQTEIQKSSLCFRNIKASDKCYQSSKEKLDDAWQLKSCWGRQKHGRTSSSVCLPACTRRDRRMTSDLSTFIEPSTVMR